MMKEITNGSGWKPLGRAILVLPEEITDKGSVIVMPKTLTDRTKMMQDRATVIAIGPEAWVDEQQARAVPGDEVILAAYSGYLLTGDDGKLYRLINERDIFAARIGEQNV